MQARFDKQGKRLPDTGRGCGCQQCADSDAARYERRVDGAARESVWIPIQRAVVGVLLKFRRRQPV